jgi:hypothetical protein
MEGFCIQVYILWMVHYLNKKALMSLRRLGFIVGQSVCPNMGTSKQILMAMEFKKKTSRKT